MNNYAYFSILFIPSTIVTLNTNTPIIVLMTNPNTASHSFVWIDFGVLTAAIYLLTGHNVYPATADSAKTWTAILCFGLTLTEARIVQSMCYTDC